MNVNVLSNPVSRSRGITFVEILLVISLLVILLSFAMPSVGTAAARAELKAATENVQYSIGAARNLARTTESSVAVNIGSVTESAAGAADPFQSITFSRPESKNVRHGPDIQDYHLPAGLRLVSDYDRYVFDSRGLVREPGRIVLVSMADESISFTIDIE